MVYSRYGYFQKLDLEVSYCCTNKVKVHTLDIASLRSESPLQKRSDMTRVLKDFTVLPAHPHIHLQLK